MSTSRISFFVVLTALAALLPGCGCTEQKQAEKKQGLFVINVLDKAMYDDCHIKGSIHVPLEGLEKFAAGIDKDASEIVVYCSNYMCTSSEFIAKKLLADGFKHVWAYEGGMAEWYQHGLPTEGPAEQAYLTKKNEKAVSEEQATVPIITVQELARKLNVTKNVAA